MKISALLIRKVVLLSLCSLVAMSPGAHAETFSVQFTGMIAFARAGEKSNQFEVLLVNEYSNFSNPKHSIVHTPRLEIDCGDLADSGVQAQCQLWPPALEGNRRALTLTDGWRVEFLLNSLDSEDDGVADKCSKELLVNTKEVSGGVEDASVLRWEALDPETANSQALTRTRLTRGSLSAHRATYRGDWNFKKSALGKSKKQLDEIAGLATWKTSIAPDSLVTIRLLPEGRSGNPVDIALRSNAEDFGVVLSNEPDTAEFCKHVPKSLLSPYKHFGGFWDLSKAAGEALKDLPLPYSLAPSRQCKGKVPDHHPQISNDKSCPIVMAGRHADCMMVLFDRIESKPTS